MSAVEREQGREEGAGGRGGGGGGDAEIVARWCCGRGRRGGGGGGEEEGLEARQASLGQLQLTGTDFVKLVQKDVGRMLVSFIPEFRVYVSPLTWLLPKLPCEPPACTPRLSMPRLLSLTISPTPALFAASVNALLTVSISWDDSACGIQKKTRSAPSSAATKDSGWVTSPATGRMTTPASCRVLQDSAVLSMACR